MAKIGEEIRIIDKPPALLRGGMGATGRFLESGDVSTPIVALLLIALDMTGLLGLQSRRIWFPGLQHGKARRCEDSICTL